MRIRLGLSDHEEKFGQPIYFPMEYLMKYAFICGKTKNCEQIAHFEQGGVQYT